MNYVLYYLLKYTIEIIYIIIIFLFLNVVVVITWYRRRKVETFFAHTSTPASDLRATHSQPLEGAKCAKQSLAGDDAINGAVQLLRVLGLGGEGRLKH